IVPTASAFATIGVPAPTEGPATTSAAAAARPSSASFMGSSFESSRSPRRAVTDTRRTVLAAPLHALSSGMPAAELHSSRLADGGEHALGASDRRARVRDTADCEQGVRRGNEAPTGHVTLEVALPDLCALDDPLGGPLGFSRPLVGEAPRDERSA